MALTQQEMQDNLSMMLNSPEENLRIQAMEQD